MALYLVNCRDNFPFTFTYNPGIAQWYSAGLRAGRSMVRIPSWAGNFSLHRRVQTVSGVSPASYPVRREDLSLGIMRPGREADHSPPFSAEVKECVELYLHSPNSAPSRISYVAIFDFSSRVFGWVAYEGVSKSFRTDRLERELRMV
jgi:hypothetical protein